MRNFLLCLFTFCVLNIYAQTPVEIQKTIDSIENTLKYTKGTIELKDGVGKMVVPEGFKYLDIPQAEKVLYDFWGNPRGSNSTLGLLLPEKMGVFSDSGYVFNIQYDAIGFVKDDDADKIDYDELLTQLQKETEEANKERTEAGFEAIHFAGWASKPFYDKEKKILHWAKEIKFGESEVNTLNYNIRILGRKGVLVMNAISTMPNLDIVKKDIPKVCDIVQFAEGGKYSDFDPKIDEVAAWSIGGLVAGKILAKAGIFAIILKFGKVIALAFFALLAGIKRFFTGDKKEEEINYSTQEEIKPKNDDVQP
jgi:uncharacterized membrane-anchored protein